MQCLPGQDIPPRGRGRGASREQGEESPEREQIGQPTHICPKTGRLSVCCAAPPARMGGGGQEGGCTRSRFHPSTGTKLWLSILPPVSGNLAWPVPSASYTHATPALCHQIRFTRVEDLTLSPLLHSALWTLNPLNKAKQYSMLKMQDCLPCFIVKIKK